MYGRNYGSCGGLEDEDDDMGVLYIDKEGVFRASNAERRMEK